jgi:hypothetical protein
MRIMSLLPQEATAHIVELKENSSISENGRPAGLAQKPAQNAALSLATVVPEDLLPLYNNPPVLSTEDVEAYFGLIRFLANGMGSSDPIGWMLVLDLADSDLEIRRLRKLKAGMIELARGRRAEEARNYDPKNDPFKRYLKKLDERFGVATQPPIAAGPDGDCNSPEQHNDSPKQTPKSKLETETTRAFLDELTHYERVDKLLEAAESRRSDMLRELRIHKESLSRSDARKNEVIDAEYSGTSAPS